MRKFAIPVTCGLLVMAGLVFSFQSHFWSESYARQRAFEKIAVSDSMAASGLRFPSALRKVEVSNAVWAFETPHDLRHGRKIWGVWFSRSGSAEIYSGDPSDPSSAA